MGAFWQAFSSNLSLVKLQLLIPPQFFSDFSFQKCDASAEAYLIPSHYAWRSIPNRRFWLWPDAWRMRETAIFPLSTIRL